MDEQNQNIDPVKPVNETQQQPTYAAGTTYAPFAPTNIPTNSLAIVSLVAGILSYVVLPFVGGIIGLITGIMARKEIKASNNTQGGDGMATVGIIISALNIVFSCLFAVCLGAFFIFAIGASGTNGFEGF